MQPKGLCRGAVLTRALAAALAGGGVLAQPMAPARAVSTPCTASAATPSAAFDAVNASDAELGIYGFPPRPDSARDPAGYANWMTAVGARPNRVIPQLVETVIRHGPRMAAADPSNETVSSSNNWSGFVAITGAPKWESNSFITVAGNFIVPAVTTHTCNDTWEYASVWAGIDGNTSTDVLQAGVEADATCSGGTTTTYYAPWYEWYPNSEMRIANLPAAAGQSFYVHVWATSATVGNAWVQNLTTNQVAQCIFAAPSGVKLLGQSAEWIIESPTVNGGLATLPQYGLDYFSGVTATTLGGAVRNPNTAAATMLTLTRGGVTYSTAGLLGTSAILFTSE